MWHNCQLYDVAIMVRRSRHERCHYSNGVDDDDRGMTAMLRAGKQPGYARIDEFWLDVKL